MEADRTDPVFPEPFIETVFSPVHVLDAFVENDFTVYL